VGRPAEALDADTRALELTENPAERRLLEMRIVQAGSDRSASPT
jgi:hypothetical protein